MTGLSSISLSGSAKKKIPSEARVYFGSHCQWIDLNKVLSDGIGCANGYEIEIEPQADHRNQLLFVEGKTILAFVKGNEKFANCIDYEEVTTEVNCKVSIFHSVDSHFTLELGQAVANLENVSLPSSCSATTTTTTITTTTTTTTTSAVPPTTGSSSGSEGNCHLKMENSTHF